MSLLPEREQATWNTKLRGGLARTCRSWPSAQCRVKEGDEGRGLDQRLHHDLYTSRPGCVRMARCCVGKPLESETNKVRCETTSCKRGEMRVGPAAKEGTTLSVSQVDCNVTWMHAVDDELR